MSEPRWCLCYSSHNGERMAIDGILNSNRTIALSPFDKTKKSQQIVIKDDEQEYVNLRFDPFPMRAMMIRSTSDKTVEQHTSTSHNKDQMLSRWKVKVKGRRSTDGALFENSQAQEIDHKLKWKDTKGHTYGVFLYHGKLGEYLSHKDDVLQFTTTLDNDTLWEMECVHHNFSANEVAIGTMAVGFGVSAVACGACCGLVVAAAGLKTVAIAKACVVSAKCTIALTKATVAAAVAEGNAVVAGGAASTALVVGIAVAGTVCATCGVGLLQSTGMLCDACKLLIPVGAKMVVGST